MKAPEEVSSGAKDQTQIVKGKRTIRIRPQSPILFSMAANSSPGRDRGECFNGDHKDDDNSSNSATTSSEEFQDSTEEEEDMAQCLILLAQGQSRESPKHVGKNYSSRKFMEASVMGANKAGFCVYECKTCSRTFPSFQALGGHRASHKKSKSSTLMAIIDQEKKNLLVSSDEEEFQIKNNNNPISPHLNSRGNLNNGYNSNKNKVHECSICGAEFSSGQALGGHMRRHRTPIGTSTTLTLNTLEPDEDQPRKRRNVLSLDLDLNLPAPDDDQRESKFAFDPKQQQQQKQASLVFSAPALVDCHY